MTYQVEDHFARNLIIIGIVVMSSLGIFILYINAEIDKKIDEGMARWQAEHDKVELMSCAELKDAMLYNQIKASDNKQRATERFLGMGCEQ